MLRVATYSIMAVDWGSLLLVVIGLALVGFAAFYAIRQRRHVSDRQIFVDTNRNDRHLS